MKNEDEDFFNGTRIKAFDSILYIDDFKTPLSKTMKSATVIKWYGKRNDNPVWNYQNLVDIRFDHRTERISHGHFVDCVEKI